jgi:hypothetical protein
VKSLFCSSSLSSALVLLGSVLPYIPLIEMGVLLLLRDSWNFIFLAGYVRFICLGLDILVDGFGTVICDAPLSSVFGLYIPHL